MSSQSADNFDEDSPENLDNSNEYGGGDGDEEGNSAEREVKGIAMSEDIYINCSSCDITFSAKFGTTKCKSCCLIHGNIGTKSAEGIT